MTYIVRRTCRDIGERVPRSKSEVPPRPLEAWEDRAAYVLLGPPGAGKTTIFKHEAERQGGHYVTARDFLTFKDQPEWHGTTLYIDGLDETRTGTADRRTPLDSIRGKLDRMGRPRFRLSCREADWFGANDRENVKTVTPDGAVTVLRLDPLSAQDIRQILLANPGSGDPDAFIASAEDRGLHGLLANPQSLRLLAVAVGADGIWPGSRMQAFDMACRTLLGEPNDDHRIAHSDRGSVSDLMDASGRLCAIQLLTGAAGYSLSGMDGDPHFLGLDQVSGEDRAILRRCLQSRLFETPTLRGAEPVHRQIAEFLAARHLAGLVDDGLPAARVLSLITGHDGVVIAGLRGLSAWFAAHSKPSRVEVVARDPVGAVLYGDASDFSPTEKRWLLDGLQREARANPWFVVTLQLDSRLGDLVSSDMENLYHEILTDPERGDSWQSFIVIVIEALRHGARLPRLAVPLMALLRDGTRWPRIRLGAIDLFKRHRRNGEDAAAELKALAADVHASKVPDPDDALLGGLLSALYPATIPETEIMQYFRLPRRPDSCPHYDYFWTGHLPRKSSGDQLATLLDALAERYGSLVSEDRAHELPTFFLRELPSKLLARYLRLSGDDVDLTRLFRWLGSVASAGDWTYDLDFGQEDFRDIREWLADRPGAWKTLLAMGLQGCLNQSDSDQPYGLVRCMYGEEHHRLFSVARPSDFGLWCLDQAVVADNPRAAEWLLGETADCLHYGRFDAGLSREVVSGRLAGHAGLKDAFGRRVTEREALTAAGRASGRHAQAESNSSRPDWHDQVKPHEDELRANLASPALLYELATVYFGGKLNVRGKSPRERLGSLLAGDENLVDAVLLGFRKTIERDDLPSDEQVIRLGTSNRTHRLALPFMAGVEEIVRAAPSGEIDFDERHLRLALAIHYTVPMWHTARYPADRPPRWFGWLLSNRPDVVADVLVRSALAKLRSGADSPSGLHELANSTAHERVARVAAMPLLRRFPVRCASGQLSSLNHLLLAARRYCDGTALLELVNEKHARHGMTVAQRVHWLVAGLCIAPETYVDRLDSFVTGNERRVRFLAEAVTRQFDLPPDLQGGRGVPALQLLIRLIGSSCRPYSLDADSDEGGMVTPDMHAADRVRGFIGQLAAISAESASQALEALSSDSDLHPWHGQLVDATYRQGAVRREAEFVYRDGAQVLATLHGGAPANAADLAALALEHLHQIARDVRDGNASGWRQYWNVDPRNRPQGPRPEDACRDTLLSDLQGRLQRFGIDVQPEGRYADDKRADIRLSCGRINVPVEIKRSCHRNLWSAVRSQLIARYTRDPGAGGHGIYLVFWFGDTDDCRPTPPMTGLPPSSSRELNERLTSTLLPAERFKIQTCAIDVAVPTSSRAADRQVLRNGPARTIRVNTRHLDGT